MEDVLEEFDVIDRFAFDYGFDLESRPVRETIASGTVVGVKGRLLVLERGGTTYAVDVRDLVGYELEDGETNRSLQSSFALRVTATRLLRWPQLVRLIRSVVMLPVKPRAVCGFTGKPLQQSVSLAAIRSFRW